jgi:hypothetical protein
MVKSRKTLSIHVLPTLHKSLFNRRGNNIKPVLGGLMIFIILLTFYGLVTPAYAYTDPGSGLLLWQLLVSAVFGAVFYFRKMFSSILKKIHRKNK